VRDHPRKLHAAAPAGDDLVSNVQEPEAVGADDPDAGVLDRLGELRLPAGTSRPAIVRKPGAVDDGGRDSGLAALGDHRGYVVGRYDHQGQIGWGGQLGD
jgi:hypothetical protein